MKNQHAFHRLVVQLGMTISATMARVAPNRTKRLLVILQRSVWTAVTLHGHQSDALRDDVFVE